MLRTELRVEQAPPPQGRLTDSELIADLRRVAKLLGHRPSAAEYDKHGRYTSTTYARRFGGWAGSVKGAGLFYQDRRRRCDKELKSDLRAVARQLGRPPGFVEYLELGRFGANTLLRRAGRWTNVLVQYLGLDEEEAHAAVYGRAHFGYRPLEDKLDDLRALAKRLGRSPGVSEAVKNGIYTTGLKKRLKTDWAGVLSRAGLPPEKLNPRQKALRATPADLLEDLFRITRRHGRAPTADEYDEQGRFASSTVARRATPERTWAAAKRVVEERLAAEATRGGSFSATPAPAATRQPSVNPPPRAPMPAADAAVTRPAPAQAPAAPLPTRSTRLQEAVLARLGPALAFRSSRPENAAR